MKEIVALEHLIEEEEAQIATSKRQLSEHEAGETKLTLMNHASTETRLEVTTELLAKHKLMLAELMAQDLAVLEEKERLRDATIRRNYYHYQPTRMKRNKEHPSDVLLEAAMIIDELPEDVQFEDRELVEIATRTIHLKLREHIELNNELALITKDFEILMKDFDISSVGSLALLKFHIPILVLQFSTLHKNILQVIDDKDLPAFGGFPKFHDWWVTELWHSHQAYFALNKWKSIIKNLCNTTEQKESWEKISDTWLFMKKLLTSKENLGFEYNLAFDTLIYNHVTLGEELNEDNLKSMEKIIKEITKKENFTSFPDDHKRTTAYVEFKRKELNEED